ncbi:hypothetical protein [Riemerella anatipestifer]|uniref:hypothetical protein n=1 Tax=Riemerella anatipestifer TaxID=34085 RepID=UPI001BDA9891|nr:hypothetical protein [Riemerella anatipestifer]MBT0551591.1 hypothetical protein [Riemerella anatipestifer]MBT0552724.1 hypothetical protein [Riemerella anatipestifer]MCE3023462.1 hypothetical protein [Riemerella anatipestifer]MDY3448126.1 hypothetical protein [Riemerella anatipestifer]QYR05551.1 hypothetical protein J6M09_02595 [Riemerella anatipestifer]
MQKLPEITKAEISQSKLKWSNDEEVSIFTARVLNFINPKFNDQHEIELAEAELYSFAKKCELTANEFLLALELASDGKLLSEPDENGNSRKVQLFREIDRLKLGEVKSAFIYLKTIDKQHEIAKEKVKKFLNPPKELTEEEKRIERFKFLENQWQMLKEKGKVSGSVIFYELIKKNLKVINIGFVEKVLQTFKPELASAEKKIIKQDVFLYFKECFLEAVIKKEKLNELTKDEWVQYWENKKQQQPKN